MAIFIFRPGGPCLSVNRKLAVAFSLIVAASGLPAMGAGYVISAKDRAQATALSQQAYVTFQSGDYDQALGFLTQSDQLKPDQPDGWNLRGVIYLKQKAYDKAQAAFTRAVALDPDLWAARFNLAEVFFQRRDFARARASFEGLLSQTDRFKEKNKWELVQYKTLVCCVLMNDEPDANKKLAKLPAQGGATPAFFFAQAALAFHAKNPAQAQKSLAQAQTEFPVAINDLFSDSLVQAGWETPPVPMAALAANVPPSPSNVRTDMVIDPQLQAASAGPLPVADAPMRPIVTPMTPALHNVPAVDAKPKSHPASAVAAAMPPTASPATATGLENGDLLLDE